MTRQTRKTVIYDLEFKKKVILEIESGQISAAQARKKYEIGGKMTVYSWLSNKNQIFGQTIIPMEKFEDSIDYSSLSREDLILLAKEERELTKYYKLKSESLEKVIDISEREYNISFTKKSGAKQ